MFTTIEAYIENGHITGDECMKLPTHAHVLITLLPRRVLQNENKITQPPNREPDPDLRGTIKINGDIMDSAPRASWNLPS